jgi:hypothetical protein
LFCFSFYFFFRTSFRSPPPPPPPPTHTHTTTTTTTTTTHTHTHTHDHHHDHHHHPHTHTHTHTHTPLHHYYHHPPPPPSDAHFFPDQQPPFASYQHDPDREPWVHKFIMGAELPLFREMQLDSQELPSVGFAIGTDIGDPQSPQTSIHPRYKAVIGQRLANAALSVSYGKPRPYLPPTYASHPARACLRAVGGRWVSQWAVLTLSLLSHTQSGIQVCFCSLSRFVAQHEPLLLPDNSCCQTQRSKNHAHAAAENMIRQFTLTLPMLLNTVTE